MPTRHIHWRFIPYDLAIYSVPIRAHKKVFASKGRIDSFNKNTCQFEAFRERTTIIRVYIIIIDGLKKKCFTYVNNNNEKKLLQRSVLTCPKYVCIAEVYPPGV